MRTVLDGHRPVIVNGQPVEGVGVAVATCTVCGAVDICICTDTSGGWQPHRCVCLSCAQRLTREYRDWLEAGLAYERSGGPTLCAECARKAGWDLTRPVAPDGRHILFAWRTRFDFISAPVTCAHCGRRFKAFPGLGGVQRLREFCDGGAVPQGIDCDAPKADQRPAPLPDALLDEPLIFRGVLRVDGEVASEYSRTGVGEYYRTYAWDSPTWSVTWSEKTRLFYYWHRKEG